MEHSEYLYFAYGSNMCRDKMRNRKTFDNNQIIFTNSWKCRLPGWKLCFEVLGSPPAEPSFASIEPSDGDYVYGVTYALKTEQDWKQLQLSEGVDKKISWYNVFEVEVERLDESGNVVENLRVRTLKTNEAMRIPHWEAQGMYPSKRYMSMLIEGAQAEKLPTEYIDALQSMPTARAWNSQILFLLQGLSFPTILQLADTPGSVYFSWPFRALCWRFYAYREAVNREAVNLDGNVDLVSRLMSFFCFIGLIIVYGLYAIPGLILVIVSAKRRVSFVNMARILHQSSAKSKAQ